METRAILQDLRKQNRLTQDAMAERLHVTRQAVSRWERGETTPGIDILKQISKAFGISINTLLGSPQELYCQSCGMPLGDDSLLAREADGALSETYCKFCYVDGHFANDCTMEEMVEQCAPHLGLADEAEARAYMQRLLPTLSRWQQG